MLLKQLKYVITIAECGSFTEAAEQCYNPNPQFHSKFKV